MLLGITIVAALAFAVVILFYIGEKKESSLNNTNPSSPVELEVDEDKEKTEYVLAPESTPEPSIVAAVAAVESKKEVAKKTTKKTKSTSAKTTKSKSSKIKTKK
jgi:hypothetical protein